MTHPLEDALADAEQSGPAQAYVVPLDVVRARIRRRRGIRAGVLTSASALVLAAGVVVVPTALRDDLAPPGATADWPAQFDSCGKPVQDVLDDGGDLTVEASLGEGVGRDILLRTVTTAPAARGWSYGLQLFVTDDDGTVVGVQEGPYVPPLDQVDDYFAGAAYAAESFPLVSDDRMTLASCAQYPSGSGSSTLRAGTYRLWVVQTVGMQADEDSAATTARAHAEVPLVVAAGGVPGPSPDAPLVPADAPSVGAPADALFRCGEPVASTAADASSSGGLTIAPDPDLPRTWSATPPRWGVQVGSTDGRTVTAHTSPAASLALVDEDGLVAGFVVPARGPLRELTPGPTTTTTIDGPTIVTPCGTSPLQGRYTAWPFLVATVESVTSAEGDAIDPPASPVVVVANPQAVTFS